jgi:hypothetical protein
VTTTQIECLSITEWFVWRGELYYKTDCFDLDSGMWGNARNIETQELVCIPAGEWVVRADREPLQGE